MPVVLFHQSKEQELETILWTIQNYKKLEKFCDETIYPELPKDLWEKVVSDDKDFRNSRELVKEYLERTRQFNQQDNDVKTAISLWRKIEKDFFKKIEEKSKIKPLFKYSCHITRFGGGGSFNPPDSIWVRLNNKKDIKYFNYTVAHEITHLLLHKDLSGKEPQRQIEKQVDKILMELKLFA